MALAKWYASNKLKEWRENNGYSQSKMVELYSVFTGKEISTSLYNQWESGKLSIQPEHLLELSAITKIEHRELANNANEKEN